MTAINICFIILLIIFYLIGKDIYQYRKRKVGYGIVRKHLWRRYGDILLLLLSLICLFAGK